MPRSTAAEDSSRGVDPVGDLRRWTSRGATLAGAAIVVLAYTGIVIRPVGADDGGSLQSLTVQVTLDPADADVANLLGWSEGRVPGAEVRVERENVDGSIANPLIEMTDAAGRRVRGAG